MQGERANVVYLLEDLNYEHGSTSSDLLMDTWENIHNRCQNVSNTSLANSVYGAEQDLRRFSIGEARPRGTKNETASHNQQQMEIIDLDPLFVQSSGANQPVRNVNLNAEYIEIPEDVNPVRGCSGFFEANGQGTRASQPGMPFEGSSVGTSSSVELRLASCKRKAFEGAIGQSSSGGYHDFQHGESSSWSPASSAYRPRNGLTIPGSLHHGPREQVSGIVPNFTVAAFAASSSRNTGNNPSNQQETVNPAASSAGTVVGLPVPPFQLNLPGILPAERPGQSSGNAFSRIANAPAVSIPPVSRSMLPPFQWTEGSLAGGSSNSTVPVERGFHLDETRPRSISGNIVESPVFVPAPEHINHPFSQRSRNLASGNLNNTSSSSRTGLTTGVPPPPSNPAWTPFQTSQNQRRRSELVRRSSRAADTRNQRSGDHSTHHSLAPPPHLYGLVPQPGGDNSQMHTRAFSRASPSLNRQGDTMVEAPHSSRALPASSRGRNRHMLSQMQSAFLDAMHRDPNNIRLEDIMLLNQSMMLDGASGLHDRHRDMRLDVDNMSYEDLLALEERIGDVCTGLTEETISKRLKQEKYKSNTKSEQDVEPCCICQEEYNEGEDMGTLECGHEFHSHCIKQWLKVKNSCPICKTTGLNTAKKRKIG